MTAKEQIAEVAMAQGYDFMRAYELASFMLDEARSHFASSPSDTVTIAIGGVEVTLRRGLRLNETTR